MKKNIKRILALLSISVMLFCFSGCEALEEARDNHGIYSETTGIIFRGKAYISLYNCDNLYPDYDDTIVYITEEGVPVLLSSMLGEWGSISKDEVFLMCSDTIYCRSDRYDEMFGRIGKDKDLTKYAVYYGYYNDETGEYENKHLEFSDEMSAIFDYLLNYGEAEVLEDYNYSYLFNVMKASEDDLFRKDMFTLAVNNDKFFMLGDTGESLLKIDIPADYFEELRDMYEIYSEDTEISLDYDYGYEYSY